MKLRINGSDLFIDIYGSGLNITKEGVQAKPTLIVLHGGHGFADHTLYVEFWSQFQDIVQVIFVDQHGCGRSDPGTPASWNYQRWASDIHALCQSLGIEKPILAGVSMGGHVIGEYLRCFGSVLGGIIFCNTEARLDIEALAEQFRRHGYPQAAEACLKFFRDPNQDTLKAYHQFCIPLYAKNAYSKAELSRCITHPEVFIHAVKNEILQFDYRPDLRKINCPTLIMAGEFGSHTPEAAQEMAQCIPSKHLTFELFKGAGSPVYKDDPLLAEATVRKFLQMC